MNARRTATVLLSDDPRPLSCFCPCGQLFTGKRLWYLTTDETIVARFRLLFGAPARVTGIGNHLLCYPIRGWQPERVESSQRLVRGGLQCQ